MLFRSEHSTRIVAVAISAISINKIRIGGATYNDIIQMKDLVADDEDAQLALDEAVQAADRIDVVPADAEKTEEAEFMMLREGVVSFEGSAAELRACQDPYIRTFLS